MTNHLQDRIMNLSAFGQGLAMFMKHLWATDIVASLLERLSVRIWSSLPLNYRPFSS